jgi:hypothetical protein
MKYPESRRREDTPAMRVGQFIPMEWSATVVVVFDESVIFTFPTRPNREVPVCRRSVGIFSCRVIFQTVHHLPLFGHRRQESSWNALRPRRSDFIQNIYAQSLRALGRCDMSTPVHRVSEFAMTSIVSSVSDRVFVRSVNF